MSKLIKFLNFADRLKELLLKKKNNCNEEIIEQESWLDNSLEAIWEIEENIVLLSYETKK